MWRLTLILLLSTSLLQRRSIAVLAGEGDEAVDSNTEEWPVYMDDCFVAFLEDGMSEEDTDGFYRTVEQEAKRGLNVTKMAEMRETSKAFVFMGDNSSAEEVSLAYTHDHSTLAYTGSCGVRVVGMEWSLAALGRLQCCL